MMTEAMAWRGLMNSGMPAPAISPLISQEVPALTTNPWIARSSSHCWQGGENERALTENRRRIVNKKIIVVDDEPNVRLGYRITLETEGFTVQEAMAPGKPWKLSMANRSIWPFSICECPRWTGSIFSRKCASAAWIRLTVIITAYGDVPHAVKAMKLGAIDFLQKPLTPEQLRALVGEVIARHEMPAAPELPPIPLKYSHRRQLHLLAAKRAINNRDFNTARDHLTEALKQNDYVIEVHNLLGVLSEMNEDYDTARKCYGRAIAINSNYEPAQQNMRRIFELIQFRLQQGAVQSRGINKLRPCNQLTIMSDILYILLSAGFFGLMLLFIWGCEKV
jgi:DNA-binding response OmpR family regulator